MVHRASSAIRLQLLLYFSCGAFMSLRQWSTCIEVPCFGCASAQLLDFFLPLHQTFCVHVESRWSVSVARLLTQLTERSVCMSSVTMSGYPLLKVFPIQSGKGASAFNLKFHDPHVVGCVCAKCSVFRTIPAYSSISLFRWYAHC